MLKIAFLIGLATIAGCTPFSPDEQAPDKPYTGPGTQEWGEVDLTCDSSGDCLTGEICSDGYCQVDRCGGDLANSVPPLGDSYYFSREDEIALADSEKKDNTYYLDAFDPRDLTYDGSYDLGNRAPIDVAGGALWGARPQAIYAAAFKNSSTVEIAGSNDTLDLPIMPVALAAGDMDLDGLDELIGVSSSGTIAICDADKNSCITYTMSDDVDVIDATAGDIDGDYYAEVIVLMDIQGSRYLYTFNTDWEETEQEEVAASTVSNDVKKITAGDLDADGIAEIVAFRDGGYFDYWDDDLEVYLVDFPSQSINMILSHETDGFSHGRDLEIADSDGDGYGEIYLLENEARVVTYTFGTNGKLNDEGVVGYNPSIDPNLVAVADHNGDAPIAELKGNVQSCQGNPVPLMLMVLPPYDEDFANGTSRVGFGNSTSTTESVEETVSLSIGVDIGYTASFGEIFKTKMSMTMGQRVSASVRNQTRMSVGTSYTLIADPGMYGPKYGGVVLSWGCFDGYKYKVDDPSNHLRGAHGENLVLTVPTGGGSSIWSTPRYNALAALSENLPEMDIPYRVGKVDTYPTSPEKLDGNTLKRKDMLFTDPPQLIASDVSRVSWNTSIVESQTNSANLSVDVGMNAGVSVAGVAVGMSQSIGWGSGYSITVGEEARFNGTIPPLPDDPSTPEDEYVSHAYGLRPYVYIQDYETADGEQVGFYVQTYTVEQ